MVIPTEKTALLSKVRIRPEAMHDFAAWQSRFHAEIGSSAGFLDLEIFSPALPLQPEWVIVQRFNSNDALNAWRDSPARIEMFKELKKMAFKGNGPVLQEEEKGDEDQAEGGVTQVFVTQVSPEKVAAYRAWMGKMHELEVKAPGFRRVFVQAPKGEKAGSWITLLQFDTHENLDRWMDSQERRAVMEESKELVKSQESHRVTSSFAGWFSSTAGEAGVPAVWKQTMLVLLVLFPIVMLEFRFLNPHLKGLNIAFGTFIGNAISVSLVSWPMMPIAIYGLYWWLYPKSEHKVAVTLLGILVLAILYLIEIALLWSIV